VKAETLFISHNAADRPFAVALEKALKKLVGSETRLDIQFSTSDQSGPQGGEKWRDWIYKQVVQARTALIVVSPHALGKPWLLWEAGACWGAALAQRASSLSEGGPLGSRQVVSIAFGISDRECPDPLRGDQIVHGNDEERMAALFERVLRAHDILGDELLAAVKRMPKVMQPYLGQVREAMLQAPSLVNEANVQDWLERLDTLVRNDRRSELGGFTRWMMLAFGREADDDGAAGPLPIDVRLHRRLGELYLGERQYPQAIEQLRLAWLMAPRDVYVLRPLAEASMKHLLAGAADAVALRDDLKRQLEAIQDLDPRAHEATPDPCALYAKYLRRVQGDSAQALEVLAAGLRANPDSYYLADLLAQSQLELGQVAAARQTYEHALAIIDKLKEQNLWTRATAAAACVALGRMDAARAQLAALATLAEAPRPDQVESIANSLREVAQRSGVAEGAIDDVLKGLEAQPSAPAT
jgi:tetratricopeptide (TPR) repeat protein